MTGLRTVVIKRSQWLRGIGSAESGLLRNGKMCCLGFDAVARGFAPEQLGYHLEPIDLYYECDPEKGLDPGLMHRDTVGFMRQTAVCEAMIVVNDNCSITDIARETQLIELGQQAGINFIFED